ncbi:ribosome biogenesis GTPase Der [Notoacmeibacter sp. MSK16QG-6]|uniref:ribosome biogenesis GTPase Der n=1 Tax=Notoacmeibacter sp. MSK16QG-6 TaxID=2957982 RepID=UPI00209D74DA|nr:ribosome biogenesis GTPase Der [Notoacmeibacter sp. MSK16QG-6]MCP1198271.1 ribosome biogenesis GTPase Der [Notoacmeibacter sp. MSK16QG-6]
MRFTAAIIGRPNVGKSTLFNRLVGQKLALVDDTPGVTRDRRMHDAKLYDLYFSVIDTAGLEEASEASLEGRMRGQTELAMDEADLILFLYDAKAGVTPTDRSFANLARRTGKTVVLVANKAESRLAEAGMAEAWELGIGDPVPISAEHGLGLPDLREAMIAALGEDVAFAERDARETVSDVPDLSVTIDDPDAEEQPAYDSTKPIRMAIVGRPNAGKSTLINAWLGEERLLTGPEAGITRDSISVEFEVDGRTLRVYDTAGMRRRSRVQEKLEKLSVSDGLRSMRFAEVVVIVLDATIALEKQDLHIVDLIAREGRAPVIAFNKWDLIENKQEKLAELREKTERLLPQLRGIRAVPVSAETERGLDKLFDAIFLTHRIWNMRISTGRLNRWLEGIIAHHPPPAVSGRRLKIRYITQAKTRPPGFVLSVSRPDALPESYQRYLINNLRETFGIEGVPIRLNLRTSDNPFANRARKR